MNISYKRDRKEINVSEAMTAYEYAVMDKNLHGAVVELNGRYPEKGRVVNEVCTEIGYVISGSGKVVIEDKEFEFTEGDQISIEPKEEYYWKAKAILFMPCSPAWYPGQHKIVE